MILKSSKREVNQSERSWEEKKQEWLQKTEAMRTGLMQGQLKEHPDTYENCDWNDLAGNEFIMQAVYPLRDTYVRNLLYGTEESYRAERAVEVAEELKYLSEHNVRSETEYKVLNSQMAQVYASRQSVYLQAKAKMHGIEAEVLDWKRIEEMGLPVDQDYISELEDACSAAKDKCCRMGDSLMEILHECVILARIGKHCTYKKLNQAQTLEPELNQNTIKRRRK